MHSVGEEGLTRLTLHICEEGLRLTEEAAHRLKQPISTWCLLLDLEGLNMRHLWRPGMKALLHIIEICEANYPETLGRVLIIRAPRVFPIMWTLVSPLIDETSRGKFLFYGGNDYQEAGGLVDYIDAARIPRWLGGPAESDIPEGGLVPKSHYMPVEEFVKDQSPGPHLLGPEEYNIYHSTSLSRGQVHEGLIRVLEKGTVITWDFDVIRHDVVFTVFRLREPPSHTGPKSPLAAATSTNGKEAAPKESNGAAAFKYPAVASADAAAGEGTSTLAPSDNSAKCGGATSMTMESQSHVSCIEKSWKEGSDFFKVEQSIVCHDGESIQGSHVTSHVGTYILQWKFYDGRPPTGHMLDEMLDSISVHQHKAKVMYYYETLSSTDYRGSMTSLQSCQSGFSSISKTSKHSTSGVSSGISSSGQSEKLAPPSSVKAGGAIAKS